MQPNYAREQREPTTAGTPEGAAPAATGSRRRTGATAPQGGGGPAEQQPDPATRAPSQAPGESKQAGQKPE
eukprot:7975561-Alexandrium_andersonii.AAC.1